MTSRRMGLIATKSSELSLKCRNDIGGATIIFCYWSDSTVCYGNLHHGYLPETLAMVLIQD